MSAIPQVRGRDSLPEVALERRAAAPGRRHAQEPDHAKPAMVVTLSDEAQRAAANARAAERSQATDARPQPEVARPAPPAGAGTVTPAAAPSAGAVPPGQGAPPPGFVPVTGRGGGGGGVAVYVPKGWARQIEAARVAAPEAPQAGAPAVRVAAPDDPRLWQWGPSKPRQDDAEVNRAPGRERRQWLEILKEGLARMLLEDSAANADAAAEAREDAAKRGARETAATPPGVASGRDDHVGHQGLTRGHQAEQAVDAARMIRDARLRRAARDDASEARRVREA